MKYLEESFGSAYLPKLLGTYEKELWDAWSQLVRACREGTMINIGAAEGYYAVGAIYSKAFTRVSCFEQSPQARQLLSKLAKLNNISHGLEVHAQCNPTILREFLHSVPGPVAIVCDVEGDEDQLLDPVANSKLIQCHLLIELHESWRPGVKERLIKRFAATHRIEMIPRVTRTPSDLAVQSWLLTRFPGRNKLRWLDEMRDIDTPWLHMTPRNTAE